MTAKERKEARYCDFYGHMSYKDFLVWQAGDDPEPLSMNGRGL